MNSNNLFNLDEVADLLKQLDNKDLNTSEMDEEMMASQRRYEEIIKKHQQEQ